MSKIVFKNLCKIIKIYIVKLALRPFSVYQNAMINMMITESGIKIKIKNARYSINSSNHTLIGENEIHKLKAIPHWVMLIMQIL